MKKSKVLLNFVKFTIAEKIAFFSNIITRMTDNTQFVTPDYPLSDANAVVNALSADNVAAKSGDHLLIAKMHQTEEEAVKIFRKLAMYVDRIADGDPVIILSSGFEISKQPEASNRELFVVEPGRFSGEMALTRKAQTGAKSYIWQYCAGALPTDEAAWVFAGASAQSTYTIKNLESGSKYWFRVAAVTIKGMEPFSAPVMKTVV